MLAFPFTSVPFSALASSDQRFDVAVIGTGMGGATLGYALARAGKRVVFLERGAFTHANALRGIFADELLSPSDDESVRAAKLRAAGRYERRLLDLSRPGGTGRFVPFIGAGTGGSSGLYGATLERFRPEDFTPRASHPERGDSALPERWPVTFAEMLPYYEAAERLYGIPSDSATRPFASERSQTLANHLAALGLKPYRLPLAVKSDCHASCTGFLCQQGCKIDSATACLLPAMADHGALLIADFEVTHLSSDGGRVTGIAGHCGAKPVMLEADIVVLAGGALETPRLLLRSATTRWPNGLGNDSGQVGRNLMRHAIDLYALRSAGGGAASPKEVAFNDFYYLPGDGKYGTVQSFGPMPPASAALHELAEATDGRPVLAKLLAGGRPLIRWAYQSMLCTRLVMASIMEDLPYADNGVEVDRGSADATLKITYRLHDAEVRRLARFRKHVRRAFQGLSPLVIKSGEDNRRIAHVCGTCRFGEDPQTSVLDRDNRAHAIENLYIVDASFLPSSGGTNPGLTIAANALRVADRILGRSR